jgi:hypothetical protein
MDNFGRIVILSPAQKTEPQKEAILLLAISVFQGFEFWK